MLSEYIKSNDFLDDLEKAVDTNPEFKAKENNYLNILKGIGLSKDAYNKIDDAVVSMVITARKEAHRIGLVNGVSLITECLSVGHPKKSIDYNQAFEREDYRKAWDLKVEAHNGLMDLLTDHGVDVDTAMKAVKEYGDGVGSYALISAKLSIPEAI